MVFPQWREVRQNFVHDLWLFTTPHAISSLVGFYHTNIRIGKVWIFDRSQGSCTYATDRQQR